MERLYEEVAKMFMAAAFAEAGEFETARNLLAETPESRE